MMMVMKLLKLAFLELIGMKLFPANQFRHICGPIFFFASSFVVVLGIRPADISAADRFEKDERKRNEAGRARFV